MALDASNVRVGVSGAISVGTATSVAPTDAKTALPSGSTGFTDLGYVSDDGVTEKMDRKSEQIKAWQNANVVREVVTEASLSYELTLIETKKEVVEFYYGAKIDTTTGKIVVIPGAQAAPAPMVIDVVDGNDVIRIFMPAAQISEVGKQVYANGEPIGYEVTIKAYPSPTLLSANGQPSSAAKLYSKFKV